MAAQKTASLYGVLRARHGRVFPRVPILGEKIGPYRPELLLVLDPSDLLESSCRIMVDTSERIRGANWKESFPDPNDPTRFQSGWHEHRWHPEKGTRDHYFIRALQDANTFREVLGWAILEWNLLIEGMESIHPSLMGV